MEEDVLSSYLKCKHYDKLRLESQDDSQNQIAIQNCPPISFSCGHGTTQVSAVWEVNLFSRNTVSWTCSFPPSVNHYATCVRSAVVSTVELSRREFAQIQLSRLIINIFLKNNCTYWWDALMNHMLSWCANLWFMTTFDLAWYVSNSTNTFILLLPLGILK